MSEQERQSPADEDVCERLHDAGEALREIREGRAVGCKPCLYGRAAVETVFSYLARALVLRPPFASLVVFLSLIVVLGALGSGFSHARLETDEEELWVEKGGRLHKEIDYTESYLPPGRAPTSEILIQVLREGDLRASLRNHLNLLRRVKDIRVERNGRVFTLDNLCLKEDTPPTHQLELDVLLRSVNPCLVPTPLDCFWEGSFLHQPVKQVQFNICDASWASNVTWSNVNVTEVLNCVEEHGTTEPSCALAGVALSSVKEGLEVSGVKGYNERPCFQAKTYNLSCPSRVAGKDELSELLRGGCSGFASNAMKWPEEILVAGDGWRRGQKGKYPEALQTVFQLFGPEVLRERLNDSMGEDVDYESVLKDWMKEFTKVINHYSGDSDDTYHGWSSNSATEVVETFSETNPVLIVLGYALMLAYCAFAFSRFDWVHSRAGAGMMGLLLVVLSVVGALGFCSYIGIAFNATSLHVLPFLVLGLGVDDMFVIGDAFFAMDDTMKGSSLKDKLMFALRQVGPNITLTSITNACGFFLAAIIPIPAMSNFAIQVGVAVTFNYFVILLGFTSYLVIDSVRIENNFLDVLCCVPAWWRWGTGSRNSSESNIETVVTMETVAATESDLGYASSHEEQKSDKNEEDPSGSDQGVAVVRLNRARKFLTGHSVLTKLVERVYSPLLQNYFVKFVVVVFFACVVVPLAVMGCARVKDGLNLLEVVPQGTPEYGFVSASLQHFSYFDTYIVTGEMDYPQWQVELLQLHEEMLGLRHIVKDNANGGSPFWLKAMIQYYQDLYQSVCVEEKVSLTTALYSLLEQQLLDRSVVEHCNGSLLETEQRLVRGVNQTYHVIPQAVFYELLTVWAAVDPVNAGVSRPEFNPPVPSWDPVCELNLLSDGMLKVVDRNFSYTQMPFYVEGLRDTEDYVEFITDSRLIIERYNAQPGVSAYPRGTPYIFWEQYFGLRTRVLLAIACILLVSLLATTFFLMDIWSALLLSLFLGTTAVEVFGFMGWIDIRFSAIPAVTLIVSVGVAVEATAPMSLYFLKACGTHNQRMHQALKHRFTPILNGGISTFLGIVMLAFSPFPFITKYFFVLLLSCIVFSIINGLLLLPVVLSLIGPPSQAKPRVRG